MTTPPHDQLLGFVIAKVTNLLKQKVTRLLKPFDITAEQLAILKVLWDQEGISQAEIAEKTAKAPPNTARILDRLEKKKIIERRNNPIDRRSSLIFLYPKGRDLETIIHPMLDHFRQKVYQSLQPGEYETLVRLLHQLLNDLSTMELDPNDYVSPKSV